MGIFDFFSKKKLPDAERVEAEHVTRHCFVLCPTAEPGDLSRASEIVAEVFGRDHSVEIANENIVTITRGV